MTGLLKLTVLLTSVFTFSLNGEWHQDLQQAMEIAKQQDRNILIVFSGSDWCRPCKQLKKSVLEQNKFLSFAEEKLVLVETDFPRRKKNRLSKAQQEKNNQLAARYNPKGQFPWLVLLDSKGNRIWHGSYNWNSVQHFINHLSKF